MANVRQIASNLGVSVATVSRALNNKPNVRVDTRERIRAEAIRLGYNPAYLRSSTQTIGLAYTGDQGRVDYGGFDAALIDGVLKGVDEQRFDVTIISLHRDKLPSESYRTFFARKGVSGVVLRTFQHSRLVCEAIAEEGVPSIVVADRFDDERVSYIGTESRLESKHAVEHLIHLGHRRIALGVHAVTDTDHQDRSRGYLDALSAHGIESDPALTVNIVADMQGGGSAIRYFMSLPDPPTAVYFTDPLATIGALQFCHQNEIKVPQQLSIVGFDDSEVRYHSFPPFTAVCQDARALGFEAALWLTRYISGVEREPIRRMLPTSFDIQQTTAAPAKTR
ncbi:MAG: LacI family DNA-binding transcriptional regulator [Planctomycetota bacterium]